MDNSPIALSPRRAVASAIVLALHGLMFWALANGFAIRAAQNFAQTLDINFVHEIVAEKLPPPPVGPKLIAPSPPVVVMPEIDVEAAPGPSPLTAAPAGIDEQGVAAGARGKSVVVLPRIDPRHPLAHPSYNDKPGGVLLNLTVNEKGKVTAANVAKSSGFRDLDAETVKEALHSWRLEPGTVDGKSATMHIPFFATFWQWPSAVALSQRERQHGGASCVSLDQINTMPVVDDLTILFEVKGGAYKRVQVHACPGLWRSGFVHNTSMNEICVGDVVLPRQEAAAPCKIEKIDDIDKAEAAALLDLHGTARSAASLAAAEGRMRADALLAEIQPPPQPAAVAGSADAAPQPAPAVVPFDVKGEKFAGRYQFAVDLFATITRKGDRYFLRLTGDLPVEMVAKTDTTFVGKVGQIGVSFDLDPNGNAASLSLRRNGRDGGAAVRVPESVAVASETAMRQRIAARKPDPERQALLRQYIAAVEKGELPSDIMSPELAATITRRWPALQRVHRDLGKFQSLKFLCVEHDESDIYASYYENGIVRWTVGSLTVDHKLSSLGEQRNPLARCSRVPPPQF